MFSKIKNSASSFKSHLTQIGEGQPISKAALAVLIFLDVFILVSVFDGLSEHTRQLDSPDEYVSYQCREIILDRSWNKTRRLDHLNDLISYRNNYLGMIEKSRKAQHPVCQPFVAMLTGIESDKTLAVLFESRRKLQLETRELERRINTRKGGYDTALLEKMADEDSAKTEVSAIKQDVQHDISRLNGLRGEVTALDASLDQTAAIQSLWNAIQNLPEETREQLKSDLRTMSFWFPVKQLGMQLLFLLPLFAIIYAWNSASIRKDWQLQTLVSSHMLVVASIPILFKMLAAVYDIIPKKLLRLMTDFLESFNLIAIWYYLMMVISVLAALFVIYLFQKKLFSHDKLLAKRISKGLCQQCGILLPPDSTACPSCGFMQYKACGHCGQLMHVHAKYCRVCGTPQG